MLLEPEIQRRVNPVPPSVRRMKRFTLNGSDSLESHLAEICRQVREGIEGIIPPAKLEGIALGGGYGRGEGGLLRTESGDAPYNDVEFYVFVRGNSWANARRFGGALHRLAEELTAWARVEVEMKIISLAKLRRSPPSLFYHDLIMGHRWVLGEENGFKGCERHREAALVPPAEATRLLMNRCAGLLFAREKLGRESFSTEDADFVFRNLAKVQLALGDAVLMVAGQYHWTCLERNRRLRQLALETGGWLEKIRVHHDEGVQFKLEPHRSTLSRQMLQMRFDGINSAALETWLRVEERRLGCEFKSVTDYAPSRIEKFPGGNPARNWLANVRVFGWKAAFDSRSLRHPRERIVNALVLMLWAGHGAATDRMVRRELWLGEGEGALIPAFRRRWSQVS